MQNWLVYKLQRVLALCEFHYCKFHYCGFSKNSINLPYAQYLCEFLAILFHQCDFLGYIWLMRILANANFFQNQKLHQARTLCIQEQALILGVHYTMPRILTHQNLQDFGLILLGAIVVPALMHVKNPIQDSIINSTQMLQLFLSFKFIQYFSLC